MENALLIANLYSGRGLSNSALGGVVRVLSEAGYLVDVALTSPDAGASDLAERYAGGRDLVAVAGGDGTLSQVVAGLLRLDVRPPVGYIPTGTANDVAATLGLPRKPLRAARRIAGGRPSPYDVGVIGDGGTFIYVAAFGAFTGAAYRTPRRLKIALGRAAYVFGAVRELRAVKSRRVEIEHDGGVLTGEFLFGGVTNSLRVAGLVKLPRDRVGLADGRFEVFLVRKPKSVRALFAILVNILAGRFDSGDVLLLHTRSVRFRFDGPVPWTRDGEYGGDLEEIAIRNEQGAIEVIL